MDLTELAFKLVIILIPGIFATQIVKNVTIDKKWDSFKFSIYSLLFGFFCYLLLEWIYNLLDLKSLGASNYHLTIWETSVKEDSIIPFQEVLYASIISIIIGVIASWIRTNRIIFKIAQFLKITRKFGEGDLYYEYLRQENLNLVYVHEIGRELTFSGYVNYYSQTDKIKELVLKNVEVFNYVTSEHLYDLDSIYFSWGLEETVLIESPKFDFQDEESKNGGETHSENAKERRKTGRSENPKKTDSTK